MEQDNRLRPGTAENCRSTLDGFGSSTGWCVGDSQTQPVSGAFDDSEFSKERGFDMIVLRDSMKMVWNSSHGTTAGNENLSGADVLAAVQQELAD